jgi:predicted nucleic acid-binding protein
MDVVYLDNSVVSARGKSEASADLIAVEAIYKRHEQQQLQLVTSDMTHREISQLRGSNRAPVEAVYALLEKVPFVEASNLVGISSWWGQYGGWNSPIFQEEPLLRRIKAIGLDQSDAQHVMIAAHNKCSVFLTFDVRTILRFTSELEKALPLRFRSPTAYESEIRVTGA